MARQVKTKEPVEKNKSVIFDFLNSISDNKKDLIQSGTVEEKEYNAFMINRWLSFSADTALYAQAMNELYWLPKSMQYDYLRFAIRKSRRYFQYQKKQKADEDISVIAEYHNMSLRQAKSLSNMFDDDDIKHMRSRLNKGGA